MIRSSSRERSNRYRIVEEAVRFFTNISFTVCLRLEGLDRGRDPGRLDTHVKRFLSTKSRLMLPISGHVQLCTLPSFVLLPNSYITSYVSSPRCFTIVPRIHESPFCHFASTFSSTLKHELFFFELSLSGSITRRMRVLETLRSN